MKDSSHKTLPIKLFNVERQQICIVLVTYNEEKRQYVALLLSGNVGERINEYQTDIIAESSSRAIARQSAIKRANELIEHHKFVDMDSKLFPSKLRNDIVNKWV